MLIGDRLSQIVDRNDPDSKALFNFGDAAVAVLLGRTGLTFELLHASMRTAPEWCDYYSGEYQDLRVVVRRRGRRKGLREAYVAHFTALVDDTLASVGQKLDDVAFLLINQSDRHMHEEVLSALGLSAQQSVYNYSRLGHMGAADTLIALNSLHHDGKLNNGDLVLLATSGRGFSWAITAFRYHGRGS